MERQGLPPEVDEESNSTQAMIADLRLRLQGRDQQERAIRAEARRLAHELAVARRLLGFAYGVAAPARAAADRPPAVGGIPRVRAVPLRIGALFTLDSWHGTGSCVLMTGWAFVPTPAWNGLTASVTVLFQHEHETFAAAAAHFAAQPAEAAGGARGLASAGFTCEVAEDSLPRGVALEIVLRLECAGIVCEQPTDRSLRL